MTILSASNEYDDDDDDDGSQSSSASSSYSSSSLQQLPAYCHEEGRSQQNPFSTILSHDQVADIVSHLPLPERCHFQQTCRHIRRTQIIIDGTITTHLSESAGHDLAGLCRSTGATVGASPYWLEDVEALRRSRSVLLGRFAALTTLDVGSLATNEFLRLLSSPFSCASGDSADASSDDGDHGDGGSNAHGVGSDENAAGEQPSEQELPPSPPRTKLLLPNLETLSMVGSRDVNSAGILLLGQRADIMAKDTTASATHLRHLNITFCPNISYGATLKLRQMFPNHLVIRRQPEWLDGHFETPFAGSGEAMEIHTYYPDGSFRFTRSQQSAGFVDRLFRWSDRLASARGRGDVELENEIPGASDDNDDNDNFLGDKLQYIDFDTNEWPGWTRFAYRPGVSLRRVADESVMGKDGKEGIIRSVLVAQCRRGYRPPSNFPKQGQQDDIPINQTRYFREDGSTIPEYNPSEDDGSSGQVIMVSKMKVRPLSSNEMVPPADLLDRIGAFVEEMASTDIPPNGGDIINSVLGGLVGTDND